MKKKTLLTAFLALFAPVGAALSALLQVGQQRQLVTANGVRIDNLAHDIGDHTKFRLGSRSTTAQVRRSDHKARVSTHDNGSNVANLRTGLAHSQPEARANQATSAAPHYPGNGHVHVLAA